MNTPDADESDRRSRIAFITIGQAPRPDVVPEILERLDPAAAYDEFGALDGLTPSEIAAEAPAPGEASLYTRLADGTHVVVGANFVEERLEALMRRLDGQGYALLVLISTGVFRPIAIATPLVHGQRAVDLWIAALVLGDCRIGVIYPLEQQKHLGSAHGTLIQNAHFAAATGEMRRLEDAAARLGSADLILMHSVGYTEAMAQQVARATGKPVVTARRIIAGTMRLHLPRPTGGRDALQPGAASGHGLLGRLPVPAEPLTPRERDVLAHVLDGRSNKTVGRLLGISHRTVEIHRARAMAKLGTTSATELIRWALIGREPA